MAMRLPCTVAIFSAAAGFRRAARGPDADGISISNTCDSQWDNNACSGSECYTCGDRINYLISTGLSDQAAKQQVAAEFPTECGACGDDDGTCWAELLGLAADEGNGVGGDIEGSGVSLTPCKNSCAGNAACLSFSYCPQWNGCWMKDRSFSGGEPVTNNGCTTHYKTSCTPAPPTPAPAPPPPGCMDILIIGDHGSRADLQWRVAAGLSQVAALTQPEAILGIGDNVYENGAEGSYSLITQWWSNVYLQYESLRRTWYVVNGNHDWYTDGRVQVDFTSSSENSGGFWQFPSLWYKRTFSSSATSADFFFIDTMVWRKSSLVARWVDADQEYTNQRNWLIGELAASTADWRIVVGHHPVYSAGLHGITSELIDDLDPIMRQYNVPIYIAGHDHSKQYIEYTGMHYIVSGAGGKNARNPSYEYPDGSLKEFIRNGGFAGLQICDGSQATLKYYSETGVVQATHQIANERPEQPPPSVRRRRRAVDMWACRRRSSNSGDSDYGDTPDGYVCSGNSIVPQTVQVAQRPLAAFLNVSSLKSECGGVTLQDVDKRCSPDGCTVLPDRPLTESCEHYCHDHGLTCEAAWAQADEEQIGCVSKASLACSAVPRAPVHNLMCRCSKA